MGLYRPKNCKNYRMSFSVDGVQHRVSTGTDDKKLAQRIFDKVRGEVAEEKWFPKKPQDRVHTYDELAIEYEEYAKHRHRGFEKTTKSALVKLRAHFGGMTLPLKRKTIIDFQTIMLAQKKENGATLKPAYVNRVLSVLRSMYTYGIDVGMLPRDGIRVFERTKLKGEIKRLRFLSVEEASLLIHSCDEGLRPIVITALNTGMRRGEILGLKWDQVDLVHNLVLLDKTKNYERREIYIGKDLRALLCELPSRFKGDFVFPNLDTDKPYVNIRRMFKKAVTAAKITDFRFHDLRHTFASQLVMAGVDLTTVKELLGHKDIKMTLRYAHLAPSHKANAIETLASRLWETTPDNQISKQAVSN